MQERLPTPRAVRMLLHQSGGTLTLDVHDPNHGGLPYRLEELVRKGVLEKHIVQGSVVQYALRDNYQQSQRRQPSDTNM